MNAQKPKYIIDTVNGTAVLELYVNDALSLTYAMEAGSVLMEALPDPVTVPFSDVEQNIGFLHQFVAQIRLVLAPSPTPLDKYKETMEKTDTGIEAVYRHLNKKLTDCEYLSETKEFTFKPRNETTLPFADFEAWVYFLKRVLYNAKAL